MNSPVILPPGLAVAIVLGLCLLVFVVIGRIAAYRAALRRARKALHMAGRIGGVGHWRVDTGDSSVWWSDEVFRIHGRAISEGPPSLDEAIAYYAPEDREPVSAAVSKAIEQGSSFQFMADIMREDGERTTVVSRGICETGSNGGVAIVYGVFVEQLPILSSEFYDAAEGNDAPRRSMLRRKRSAAKPHFAGRDGSAGS